MRPLQISACLWAWSLLIFAGRPMDVNGAIRTPAKAGVGGPPPRRLPELVDLFHVSDSDGFTSKFTEPPLPLDDFDLRQITNRIGPQDFFEEMSPAHREAVQELEKVLRGFHLRSDFSQIALALRDHSDLNPTVWIRAVLATILKRPDRAHFRIPALMQVEPDFALPAPVVRELLTRVSVDEPSCVVVDDRTGFDNGDENRLWYFREDPMVNSHHWFWHLMHPYDMGPYADRHGELFYATHHSISARYHAERLSIDLPPVNPFVLDDESLIPEGYNPHLTDLNSQQEWIPRPHKQPIPPWAIARGVNVTMGMMRAWHAAIVGAINDGYLQQPNGTRIDIQNARGIDTLAIAVEATTNTANMELYGWIGYHNSGHSFIGNSVIRPGEPTPTSPKGVMAGTVGSMRDPIFYRWHEHMNRIYDLHKCTLDPYKADEGEFALNWPGVQVERVEVQSLASTRRSAATINELTTYFTQTSYDLTNGLDFKRNFSEGQGKVEVCVKHLAHEEFEYRIQINNANEPSTAAVRIFLAPRFGPGLGTNPSVLQRYPIAEQHKLFFPLDTFVIDLSTGPNSITRSSKDSTTTISLRQGLTELNQDQIREQVYCGCGWPDYMLLPKGKPGPAGMVFDLFVMVTKEEHETRIPKHAPLPQPTTRSGSGHHHRARAECQEAYLMCGRYNSLFPDPKPMLYPFDRRPRTAVGKFLEDFMNRVGNMATTQVTITHLAEADE